MKINSKTIYLTLFLLLIYIAALSPVNSVQAQVSSETGDLLVKPLSEVISEIMDPANVDQETRRGPRRRSRSKSSVAKKSFSNFEIRDDLGGVPLNRYIKENFENVTILDDGLVSIPKVVTFSNCDFDRDLKLDSLSFGVLHILNSKAPGITFSDCSIIQNLTIDGNMVSTTIDLHTLTIKDLIIKNNQTTKIILNKLNSIRDVSIADNTVEIIEVSESSFDLPAGRSFRNFRDSDTKAFNLVLTDNHFRGDSAANVELRSNYTDLVIENNQFDVDFFLVSSSVRERFIVVDNEFNKQISFENFIFSETKNELYWDQFEGYKLAYSRNGQIFEALTPEGFEDVVKFKNLVSTYKEMHKIFLNRGDLESANACYNEMKELQGRRFRYVYDTEGGFNNLFRWMLNRLLKIYTNHGTDPALAVVISFYVILAFAVFYFFFPSEWDKQDKLKLIYEYRMQRKEKNKSDRKSFMMVMGLLGLSLINAITLSLNSFTTLGFGTIPTKGVARYLCIIEGFLGWFLLSIFTVALINQVLA
jgi:hypothetical protein